MSTKKENVKGRQMRLQSKYFHSILPPTLAIAIIESWLNWQPRLILAPTAPTLVIQALKPEILLKLKHLHLNGMDC